MADVPVVYTNDASITSVNGTTIDVDFSSKLIRDYEDITSLLTFVTKIGDEPVLTNEFGYFTDRRLPRTTTLSAASAAGTAGSLVTLSVVDSDYFIQYDQIEISGATDDGTTYTSQAWIVSSASNSITCRPTEATLAIGPAASGSTVRKIASDMSENGSGRYAIQTVPTKYNLYTQTFENYYKVSWIQDKNRQYTDPERSRLREDARREHAFDIDYAMMISELGKDAMTDATLPKRTMLGLMNSFKTNKQAYGQTLTLPTLFNFMRQVHAPQYAGGKTRMVWASADLIAQVNMLANNSLRTSTKDSTWGPAVTQVQFGNWTWNFVESWSLSDARPGYGIVVAPQHLKRRSFTNTIFQMNVQNPIDKFYKDGFYTVTSIQNSLEEAGGILSPS